MFSPEEIIFAPTTKCNLHCAHCRVTRLPDRLDTGRALAFLEDCAAHGIELVGFSGGEPFLEPDFLVEITRAALSLGMRFDRLMTNGVWWKDEAGLRAALEPLFDAGFDGTFGLSADAWHGQDPARLSIFALTVFDIWNRRDCIEILAVEAPGDGRDLPRLEALALSLGGELLLEEGRPVAIVDRNGFHAGEEGEPLELEEGAEYFIEEDPAALYLPIVRSPYSAGAGEAAWADARWFEDDFCEGPGQVFYVHPDGRVAACCGFANERDALIIGNISTPSRTGAAEGYEALMAAARASPLLASRYASGLGKRRRELEAGGLRFPGKTQDQCFFCDWLCEKGLG